MRRLIRPIYVVKQFERGIVEFTRVRDTREHAMDIEPQPVITKDNVEIQVDGLIWIRHGLEAEDIQKTYFIN